MLKTKSILWRAPLGGLIAFALWMPASGFLAAQPQDTPKPAPPLVMDQVEELARQGNTADAIGLLQSEISRSPDRMDLQVELGNLAVRVKRYDLAIAGFQRALDLAGPESRAAANVHLRLGETYRRKGDLNLAIESLQHAKRITPDNVAIVSTLALSLDAAERIAEAHDEYEAVLALDPDHVIALNNLAYLLAHQNGNLDRALDLAHRALELMPGNNEISDTIGWIHLKRNLPDDAIAAFREVIQAAPSNPIFHYHLGMAFSQKGDKTEAIGELRMALTLFPTPPDREKIRQLLAALQR